MSEMHSGRATATAAIAARVDAFVRQVVVPYEADPRRDHHEQFAQ
jgi:acyl-CoA dehydrogenase